MPAPDSPLIVDGGRRVPALDGVRGVALLAVVCCHLIWPAVNGRLDAIDRVLVNGWIGVDLFFVLSGFLITGILIDARDTGARGGYFRNFYARRALRIFPIYYLFLALLCVWIPFGSWYFVHGMGPELVWVNSNQAWYWTYTVNVLQARAEGWSWTGHLWSLSVEEQFYLVWPAVVLLVSRRRLPVVCIAAFVAAIACRAWWVESHARLLGAYILTPMRMDSLAAGACVATLARTPSGSAWLRRWSQRIGLAALVVALPIQVWFGADSQQPLVVLIGYSASAIVFAALIVWIFLDERPRRYFDVAWLRGIGRISYGAYLYHLPLIALCAGLRSRLVTFGSANAAGIVVGHALWVAAMIGLTLVVAATSYRWIEQPFLDMKGRFAGSRTSDVRGSITPVAEAS